MYICLNLYQIMNWKNHVFAYHHAYTGNVSKDIRSTPLTKNISYPRGRKTTTTWSPSNWGFGSFFPRLLSQGSSCNFDEVHRKIKSIFCQSVRKIIVR